MSRPILIAALLSLNFAANAQSSAPLVPVGMVATPCEGLVVPVPPAVKAYIGRLTELTQAADLPPAPAELAAYRQANSEARKSDWADLCRYRADNERLRAGPASARRIVFMGDSITQNWGADDPAFFSGGIVNRGISGQTTPQMLVRFQSDVVALKPEIVHIMAGTNDIAGNTGPSTPEDYRNNIRAMVTLAKANGIKVILGSVPPVAAFTWKPDLEPAPQVAELNDWLRDYSKNEKLVFVDYYSVLSTPDRALRPDMTFDGIHPNHSGYQMMAPLALAALRQ